MDISFVDVFKQSSAFASEETRQQYSSVIRYCFDHLKNYQGPRTVDVTAINIIVHDVSDTDSSASCGYNEDQPNVVHLFLRPGKEADPWLVLCHEIIHAFQRLTGRLTKGTKKGISCWDGNEIMTNIQSHKLPWEKEANQLGLQLSMRLNGTAYNPFQGIFADD